MTGRPGLGLSAPRLLAGQAAGRSSGASRPAVGRWLWGRGARITSSHELANGSAATSAADNSGPPREAISKIQERTPSVMIIVSLVRPKPSLTMRPGRRMDLFARSQGVCSTLRTGICIERGYTHKCAFTHRVEGLVRLLLQLPG